MINQSILQCQNITKQFEQFTAVDKLSFSVNKGEFFSILGPSGCGKTTLLRMLAGFETPSSGKILLKNKDVTDVAPNMRSLNMVFQHLALFPNMSVGENIAYGLKRRKEPRAVIANKVKDILARVDLSGSESKRIGQLSGGQKQRIALARCLVLNPSVLLLDEPLGALDLKLREQMKLELKHLQREFGTTFIYITHDQSEAMMMSDRVAVMNKGRFEQVAAPQALYLTPESQFVAEFVGENNRIQIDSSNLQLSQKFSHLSSNTGASKFYLRPESIVLGDHLENQIQADVEELLFDAANSGVIVNSDIGKLRISVSPSQLNALSSNPNKQIAISWASEDIVAVNCRMAG